MSEAAPSRLRNAFSASAAQDRAALVLYVTAGHPSPAATLGVLEMLAGAGADVIELGVPFSDPLADGPVIQRASQAAIAQGATLPWVLETLAAFRLRHDTPVVIFSYLNPLLRYGLDRFLDDAASNGADGVLVTDLPTHADPVLEDAIVASGLQLIRLIAPTTSPARVREIAADAQGFLYYISRTGVTGEETTLAAGLRGEIAALREVAAVPIAVGFGIATPEQARTVARVADGVVVGSALVRKLAGEGTHAVAEFVAALRAAMQR